MKKLHAISLSRLSVLEFGEAMNATIKNIEELGVGFITDVILLAYITALKLKNTTYDLAMVYMAKSDETKNIVEADIARDKAITAFEMQLAVYGLSEVPAKKTAFFSLDNLMNTFKGVQKYNFQEETTGINNLLAELNTPKYNDHILTLGMDEFVVNMTLKNQTFDALYIGRTQELASKETYDVKALRKDMQANYEDLCGHTLYSAKGLNTPQFNDSLKVINAVRKQFYDLLAIRAGIAAAAKADAKAKPPTE